MKLTTSLIFIKLFIKKILKQPQRQLIKKWRNRIDISKIPLQRAAILSRRVQLVFVDSIESKFSLYTAIFIILFTHILIQKPKSVTKFRQRRAMKSKAKQLRISSTAFIVILIKLLTNMVGDSSILGKKLEVRNRISNKRFRDLRVSKAKRIRRGENKINIKN